MTKLERFLKPPRYCIIILELNMENRIRLPIGKTDFERIRREGCYYVDKTDNISRLIRDGADSVLFTRPRRFGKTTFQSMLKSFFDIREDNKDIFTGLAVMEDAEAVENWMNKYPVIYLTFKDIDGLNFSDALDILRGKLSSLFSGYDFITIPEEDEKNTIFRNIKNGKSSISEIRRSLEILSELLYLHYGKKVIILLDEYDVPLDKAEREEWLLPRDV